MNPFQDDPKIGKDKAKDINLKELYFVIKRRFWLLILSTVLFTCLGAYYTFSTNVPLYESSSRIIIGADPEFRNTLQVIIKDSTVLQKVVNELGLGTSPESLAGQITIQSIDNSQVVSIGVTDTNPKRAAEIANTVSRVFKEQIPNIVGFKDVKLLSDAKVNPWPINQNQNKIIMISSIVGVVMGIGLIFLVDSLDDTIRSEIDLEAALGLPVLASTSKIKKRI
ncbi:Wzz/FepE/Etk N-terminal domain-containing protein [Neobacillus sp. PS3-34]|uniref:YveK family protein n=1 Tax=Neobacillus sp. PS3-34 TaxID=3070678 RepID=UPI0027E1902D|nr:Wzz/FepE/Etk N-terminal domain-containing protein [Neobacillus sp. PS3-34]WML47794.1 Wzz/FepE/Etk N-terminal domain-containing protein [Neobacillus sp. PS3-34]